ncbi:MFS transporter [Falsirhodobacter halotolerans]|uniref:MFS transporter n=1 Tax=Falsirhodobacter halotolerans TaxID=1146892 RepID=UPI001FD5974E|nr:MFS transporter [Falsirhodobacter halotolerans]MCJ8140260.1 MFS transporter [Falsirhodobacter halotolerans]
MIQQDAAPASLAWLAVFSLTMGVFGLLTSEYLPASLLTPMAGDLGVSEALAGQAVTVTAVVALVSGLMVPIVTRALNRRTVLLSFTVLMIASNLLVALSTNFTVLLVTRALLDVALGGFWSMVAAIAMRLVPARLLPRAISIIFSGIAVGAVVSVPLGSYMGGTFGWRSAFNAAAGLGALTLLVQAFTLPSMAPGRPAALRTIWDVVTRPGIAVGMLGCILAHTGHYALFTYIRPFLEASIGIGSEGLAVLLLAFGAANFAGTLLVGWLMERNMRATMALLPAVVGLTALALALTLAPVTLTGHSVLVVIWGLAFGGVPVAWSAWVASSVPDQAESAGGMVVASVQGSIAEGAAAGGAVFSTSGVTGVFLEGGVVMLAAAALILLRVRMPWQSSVAAIHI